MNQGASTFKLFKQLPSFTGGIASMFDYSDVRTKFNGHKTGKEADNAAIKNDWEVVGLDMNNAINSYAKSTRK